MEYSSNCSKGSFSLSCNSSMMESDADNLTQAPNPIIFRCRVYEFTIYTVIVGLLCILGLIGNLFAYLVFTMDTLKTSTLYLFQTLSLTDTLLLITCFPIYSIGPLMNLIEYKDYDHIHAYVLVICFPLAKIFQTATIWVTVLVGFNRYIAVCRPYQAASMCSVQKSRQFSLLVYILSIVYNFPLFLSGKIQYNNETNQAEPVHTEIGKNNIFNIIYNNILYTMVMLAVPVVILVALNFKIIATLKEVQKRRCQMQTRQQQTDQNVTFVLIIVMLVFTVCQFPALCNQIFWNVLDDTHRDCNGFQFYFSRLSNMMVIVNSAVNFVIYVIFNTRFRSEMMEKFCKCLDRNYTECGKEHIIEQNGDVAKDGINGDIDANGATQTMITHV